MLFSDHEATAMMRLACHAIGSADGHAAIFVPEEIASQNASSLRLLASTSDSAVVTALTQAAALSSDRLGSLLRRTQAPGGEPVVLLSTSVASDPAERFLVAVGCHPTLGAPSCDSAAAGVLCVVEANPRASPPSAKDMEALSLAGGADLPEALPAAIAVAIHRYVARTPSLLLTVQLEDMVGQERQPNLPGTTDQYPNWRIRSDVPLEGLIDHERFRAMAKAMREERPNA